MDEQGTDATDEDAKRYVDDPVDAEVEDGEDEQGCVNEDKEVVRPVPPFPECSSLFLHVQVIQHQDAERNSDMKAWDGIIQRVVKRGRRCTSRHGRAMHPFPESKTSDFNVEKEVVRNRKGVNQEIIERDLVRHVPVAEKAK